MNGKHTACVNDLVRQVALMMDDCEQHADGRITIDCDISQGFLRRIYDLLIALEDSGYDAIEPQPSVVYQCPRCSTSMQVDETAKPAAVPEAVAKDAERYRWLRSQSQQGVVKAFLPLTRCHYVVVNESAYDYPVFDDAIDAAILSAADDEVKNG